MLRKPFGFILLIIGLTTLPELGLAAFLVAGPGLWLAVLKDLETN